MSAALATGAPPPPPTLAARAGAALGLAAEWLIGLATVVAGLAALAAVPVAQVLSLGYMLAAAGRVAAGGRLADAAIGIRRAARVGTIAAGCWLGWLPVRLVAGLAASARWVDPGGPADRAWRLALPASAVLMLAHLAASCARGGRLRHFAWPPGNLTWLGRRLRRGGLYAEARDATWDFVMGLRLGAYFRLGLLGFLGSMAWLAGPVTLLILGRRAPALGLIGGAGLGLVAMLLPFLQVRFAVEGRFGALFEVGAVRERFRRAPCAFAGAFLLTVLAAAPLHLLKVERVPPEVVGLASVLFVALLLPARVACGWAYARAERAPARRHWAWRGLARLGMLPAAAAYVLILFGTQYTSWGGAWSLYEQHAFLIPAPFLRP